MQGRDYTTVLAFAFDLGFDPEHDLDGNPASISGRQQVVAEIEKHIGEAIDEPRLIDGVMAVWVSAGRTRTMKAREALIASVRQTYDLRDA